MTCKDCLHFRVCNDFGLITESYYEKTCAEFEYRDDIFDKQTPKKPLRKVPGYDGYYDFPCYEYFCPVCEKRIAARLGREWHCGKPQKYCDECGQALDWSDYE